MAETIYFLGVRDGNRAVGELVFPGQGKSFHAISGTSTLRRAPEATYGLGKRENAEKAVSLGRARYKYRLIGVARNGKRVPGGQYDPFLKRNRSGLLIHPDGNGPGTAGCIGVRGTPATAGRADPSAGSADLAAAQDVDRLLNGMGDKKVVVKYFDSVEEMEAFHKQVAPDVDVKKPGATRKAAPKRRKKAPARRGKPSKTNRGAEILRGEPTVMAGRDRLEVAYARADCVHTGGGCIVQGSRSVFVGRHRSPLARVTDPTSDGHRVQTGENTVESA